MIATGGAVAKFHLNRQLRGQARRAINRINTVEAREFPSSTNPDVTYRAVVYTDGKVMCDCRGWTIKKRHSARRCKHTDVLIGSRPSREDGEYVYLIAGGN